MEEKRTYKEVVASLETQMIYTNNHLQNIDAHLDKLNDRTRMNEVNIATNSTHIKIIYGVGGSLLGTSGIAAIVLKVLGIY